MTRSIPLLCRTLVVLVFAALLATPLVAEEPAPTISAEARARIAAALAKIENPADDPDLAARYWQAQRQPRDGRVDTVERYRQALDLMARLPRAKRELMSWEFLGPGNIGGRTRALVIDHKRPRIRYAAGISGGIWKTVDNGLNWRPLADLLPNIAVSALAMDPRDPEVIYAGTGEGYFREVVRGTSLPLRGAGIFKTTDGGETWRFLEATRGANFHWVNDIVVSHGAPRRLYAATRTGVWRSLDAGQTWNRILDPQVQGGCLDLEIRTDRPNDILYAACGTFEQATVYRLPRANANVRVVPVLSEEGMGRTSLALAPSNQNVIYALSTSYLPGPGGNFQGGLHAVFRSDAAGTPGSWRAVVRNDSPDRLSTLLLTNPVIANVEACQFNGQDAYSTLGWYTNMIAVDPTDSEVVFAGGVDLFRSDDGGQSWGPISFWWGNDSLHADQHVMVFHPRYNGESNQTLFVGGDGGVYRTSNARAPRIQSITGLCDPANGQLSWTPLNTNYGVTQFYHGAPFPDGRSYLGGTQDNGTVLGSEAAGRDGWRRVLGGDGGYVAIDPRNPQVIYGEAQGLQLRKTTDGGQNWSLVTDGITDQPGGGDDIGDLLFIVPFILDPNNPDRLWFGGRHAWRSDDGAETWTRASAPWPSRGRLSAVAVAPGDSQHVVVGLDDGWIHVTRAGLGAGPNTQWEAVRPRAGFVSWAAFDPVDPQHVYATYATFGGHHVWASDDGGSSWQPIDGDGRFALPDLPVHSIVVDPTNRDRLFLGTDLGVFVSTSRGNRWAVENAGFANAVTEALHIQEAAGGGLTLFAFTHGRGAWRARIVGR